MFSIIAMYFSLILGISLKIAQTELRKKTIIYYNNMENKRRLDKEALVCASCV